MASQELKTKYFFARLDREGRIVMNRITRQRAWQLRRIAAGLCRVCGQEACGRGLCHAHAVKKRERVRAALGCRRRNFGAASYAKITSK